MSDFFLAMKSAVIGIFIDINIVMLVGQKDFKKESLESKLQLSLLTRSTQSPNSKFSLQLYCCAFSLLELTICIETAFYRNERYLFVT